MNPFLFFLLNVAFASYAPKDAPNYPSGWCNTRYGTATRTTGECVCKYDCNGIGCQRSQGVVWYDYAKCPNCECVPKDPGSKAEKTDVNRNMVNDQPIIFENEVVEEDDDNFESSWFADSAKYIFAGIVCFCLITILFVFIISSFPEAKQPNQVSDKIDSSKTQESNSNIKEQ